LRPSHMDVCTRYRDKATNLHKWLARIVDSDVVDGVDPWTAGVLAGDETTKIAADWRPRVSPPSASAASSTREQALDQLACGGPDTPRPSRATLSLAASYWPEQRIRRRLYVLPQRSQERRCERPHGFRHRPLQPGGRRLPGRSRPNRREFPARSAQLALSRAPAFRRLDRPAIASRRHRHRLPPMPLSGRPRNSAIRRRHPSRLSRDRARRSSRCAPAVKSRWRLSLPFLWPSLASSQPKRR
jgi:hypothetical protein